MASLEEVVQGVLAARVPSWLDEDGNPATRDTVPLGTAVGAARTDSRLSRDLARQAVAGVGRLEDKIDAILAKLEQAGPTEPT